MAHPPQISPEEAKRKILDILKDGDVILTYHYSKDRRNLRNAQLDDVLNVLENGEIKR